MTPQRIEPDLPPGNPHRPAAHSQAEPADRARAHLAHELANLLDGSLRNVALVMASLRDEHKADPSREASPDLVARLETANHAMRQMASMIQSLLDDSPAVMGLRSPANSQANPAGNAQAFTLQQAVEHVLHLLGPIAAADHIELRLSLDPQAGQLPVGPLFPVLVNAVRNSLQAMVGRPASTSESDVPAWVKIVAGIQDNQLELRVEDNGPGLDPVTLDSRGRFRFGVTTRPQGHGLGLPLARDIIHTLGGQLQLLNGPADASVATDGDGTPAAASASTQFIARIPLHRLASETPS